MTHSLIHRPVLTIAVGLAGRGLGCACACGHMQRMLTCTLFLWLWQGRGFVAVSSVIGVFLGLGEMLARLHAFDTGMQCPCWGRYAVWSFVMCVGAYRGLFCCIKIATVACRLLQNLACVCCNRTDQQVK